MSTRTATATEQRPRLSIKGIRGDIEDDSVDALQVTPKNTSFLEMRRRLEKDGYLFIKNLIPRHDVLRVRKHYFEHYEGTGMLRPGTAPEDGIYNDVEHPSRHAGIGAGNLPPDETQVQKMVQSHVAPQYLQFLEHASLRQTVRDLMGWKKEVLLRRTMLRHNIPGGLSTGVHYDKLFLRGGGAYFLTAWVPIGDISLHGGGLIYLSDSTSLGHAIEDEFTSRANVLPESERVSAFNAHMGQFGQLSDDAGDFQRQQARGMSKWLVSEFEAGDVVFHDPYTIHGSSRNEDEGGKIRLSTDLRFYEEGSDLDNRWMKHWSPGDGL